MKDTGIKRCLDDLGRVCLPKEMRDTLHIAEKDAVEIYVDEDRIVLRKFYRKCVFCGDEHELSFFRGKPVCSACLKEIIKAEK